MAATLKVSLLKLSKALNQRNIISSFIRAGPVCASRVLDDDRPGFPVAH